MGPDTTISDAFFTLVPGTSMKVLSEYDALTFTVMPTATPNSNEPSSSVFTHAICSTGSGHGRLIHGAVLAGVIVNAQRELNKRTHQADRHGIRENP